MGIKINRAEFEKRFKRDFKTATVAREIGYEVPTSLYNAMNPNSKFTIGKEKVCLMKEKYGLPEDTKMFYEN